VVEIGKSSVCTFVTICCLPPVSRREASFQIYSKNDHGKLLTKNTVTKRFVLKVQK